MFNITNLVGENKVSSLRIENLESETAGAVNELIDILLVQDISLENGLEEITVKAINNSNGPFDPSLLARLAEFSTNLSKLEVSFMLGLTLDDRQSLVNMMITIF